MGSTNGRAGPQLCQVNFKEPLKDARGNNYLSCVHHDPQISDAPPPTQDPRILTTSFQHCETTEWKRDSTLSGLQLLGRWGFHRPSGLDERSSRRKGVFRKRHGEVAFFQLFSGFLVGSDDEAERFFHFVP